MFPFTVVKLQRLCACLCLCVWKSPVHCETQTRISNLCIALDRFLSDIELSKGLNVQSGVWGVTRTNSAIVVNGICADCFEDESLNVE